MRLSRGAVLVALCALAVRLAYVQDARHGVTFESPLVDAMVYDRDARRVAAQGPGALELPYYQPPGYPLLLGAVYALTGGSWVAPRVLQAALGAATVALVFLIAARLRGRRAGFFAAGLLALYGPALYFEGELLPPTVLLFLHTAAVLLLLDAADRGDHAKRPILAAFLLGLSTVMRPTSALLALGAAVWWLRTSPVPWRCWLGAAVAFVAPVLPITAANVLGGGERVLVSYNGGINFYLGNGANPDSLVAIQPGHAWDRLQVEPFRAGVRTRAAESAYWTDRALREAAADPAGWARALGRKVLRLLDARETPRNTDWEAFRPESRVLSLPLVGFGVLAPLAFAGMAVRGVGGRRRTLPIVAVAAVAAQNLAFFVADRYRLEAVPMLAVLAGIGVDALLSARGRAIGRRAAAVCLVLAVVVHVDFLGERRIDEARAAINRGVAMRRSGLDAGARREFLAALSASPQDPDAHLCLAEIALERTELSDALAHFDSSLAGAPDYVRALLGRAATLERLGRKDAAEETYRRGREADPWSTDVLLNYGVFLALDGRESEARAAFEQGLLIDSRDERLRRNLQRLEGGS
jgi:tetratricopeptide (TPR) repeat protein